LWQSLSRQPAADAANRTAGGGRRVPAHEAGRRGYQRRRIGEGRQRMKLLAIDTATERCSVALALDGRIVERIADTPRGHADLVLPMVESVLTEGRVQLADLDGLAYGRGPGAFTGVRIAVGVAQGLSFGAGLLTVGVSDLAAVARQVAQAGERVLVCMDARMGEVYWAVFEYEAASGC